MKEPTQVPDRRFCSTHSSPCMQWAHVNARPCKCASAWISAAACASVAPTIELWALGILPLSRATVEQGAYRPESENSGLFLRALMEIGRMLPAKPLTGGQQLGRFAEQILQLAVSKPFAVRSPARPRTGRAR